MEDISRSYRRFLAFIIIVLLGISFMAIIAAESAFAQDTPEPDAESAASIKTSQNGDYILSIPGGSITYNLILENTGEQWESYYIEIEADDAWGEIDVEPHTSIGLAPEDTKNIEIKFDAPKMEGYYYFDLIVKTRNMQLDDIKIQAIVTSEEVIIPLKLKPVLIIKPSKEHLGTISPGETLEVDIEVDCYIVSVIAYLESEFLDFSDTKFNPEEDLDISIKDSVEKEIEKGESEVFTLILKFSEKFDKRINSSIRLKVEAKAVGYEAITNDATLNFFVRNKPRDDSSFIQILTHPIAIIGISTIVIIGTIGAAISSNEVGKYAFMSLFFIPLYTKLHKNKILDHFTRGRVYEYIRNNPGVHYSEMKRELDLNNGNLSYHLHTLEREELIRSRSSGRFKLFFPTDVKIPKDMEPQISSTRRQILDIIRKEPGITQIGLAKLLPTKKQRTISYHVKTMSREGILRLEKNGRETKCYITDKVIEIKSNSVVFKEVDDDDSSSQFSDNVFRQI